MRKSVESYNILGKVTLPLSNLRGRKILVTGADGFIGSHLTEELLRRGFEVRSFVYYNSFNSWGWIEDLPLDLRKRLEVFTGDIRDPFGVNQAMKGCQIVFHLAALIAIPFSYHSPQMYVETNIQGTLNVIQAARDLGIERVIHTSTSEVYGTAKYVPITEDHPLQGQSPYSATKIGADQLANSFYHSFGTPITTVRPFNTYGPRQSARAVIPTVITQLMSGAKCIRLGSLHPTRDFNYVSDIVRGFICAAESSDSLGEVVNLGSSFEISIGELVNLIGEIMEIEVGIEEDAARIRPMGSEVERLLAENAKARRLLGWEPIYSGREGLRKGLHETVKWFKEARNINRYKPHLYNI